MFTTLKKKARLLFGYDPLTELRELMPQLTELKHELQKLRHGEGIDQIVPFFNLVSPWHDRRLLVPIRREIEAFDLWSYGEIVEDLDALTVHFRQAGRDSCGMNRTEPGQTVTEDNVFLGDIYGLFTNPVSFWRRRKNNPKNPWKGGIYGGIDYLRTRNEYDVVSDQAREFMNSHINPMCEIIERLERAVEKA